MKKEKFNKDKRCNMCNGISGESIGGFSFPLDIFILNDKFVYLWEDEKDEENIIDKKKINFCPYCGCQLRKNIDWKLCD